MQELDTFVERDVLLPVLCGLSHGDLQERLNNIPSSSAGSEIRSISIDSVTNITYVPSYEEYTGASASTLA
jgi:hypothetical protein